MLVLQMGQMGDLQVKKRTGHRKGEKKNQPSIAIVNTNGNC